MYIMNPHNNSCIKSSCRGLICTLCQRASKGEICISISLEYQLATYVASLYIFIVMYTYVYVIMENINLLRGS